MMDDDPAIDENEAWREIVETMFDWHVLSKDQTLRTDALRAKGREMAMLILETTPPSTEQEEAIRLVRMAVMLSNQAIACWEDDTSPKQVLEVQPQV